MATLERLESALLKADAAGDVESARVLAGEIRRMRGNESAAADLVANPRPNDPTRDMSGPQKFAAGAGKAMYDVGRAIGQPLGLVSQQDIEESRRLDAPLMNTGAGTAGNIVGTAATLAPAALIPGANTVVGAGLIGAGTGAALTPGTLEERGQAAFMGVLGGVLGQSIPAAYRTVKAAARPLTKKGQDQILADLLRKTTGDNAADVAARLRSAKPLVPGSMPTAAEVGESGGLAALQRAMSSANPEEYAQRGMEQASARLSALRGIAGDDAARAAQQKIVDETAKRLYGDAFKESVEVTPELAKLAARPSMRAAEKRATALAAELSAPFKATLDDMRPKYIPMKSPQSTARVIDDIPPELVPLPQRPNVATVVQDRMDPYLMAGQVEKQIPAGSLPQQYFEIPGQSVERTLKAGRPATSYMEIPPVDSVPVRDLHTVKMGMDAMLSDPTIGIAGREAGAIRATRERLLDQLPESYQVARQAHIDLNKPIHQMDIASELVRKVSPALSDHGALAKETGAAYAAALRNSDDLAKNVTGLKNATLESIMTPDQMSTLQAVAQDLARKSNAQDLGRGVGSNTFQNFAMNSLAESSGMPSAVGGLLGVIPGVGTVANVAKAAGGALYKSKDEAMKQRMAQMLLNPEETAGLLELALTQPGRVKQMLSRSSVQAIPGILGASLPAAQ